MYFKKSNKDWTIKIVIWEGTQTKEFFTDSWDFVEKIVQDNQKGGYVPLFFDREGNPLTWERPELE